MRALILFIVSLEASETLAGTGGLYIWSPSEQDLPRRLSAVALDKFPRLSFVEIIYGSGLLNIHTVQI